MGLKKYIIISSLLTCVVGSVFIFTAYRNNASYVSFFSPVPDFLTRTQNDQVLSLSLFLPLLESAFANETSLPVLTAESALLYDLTTKKVLYEKNASQKRPLASLTKIMTAIIALENNRKEDRYVVSKEALVGENSMGLSEGEALTLEELLYGLILPSGNDAAEVLAASYPGGRSEFIQAMNRKVKALGLSDTHFTNPSGLQGDGEQHTTAYDLLVITNYALKNPLFVEVVSTFQKTLPYSFHHKAFYLENETNLLTSYPGVKGVKTGYTPEAGLCLVTYLDYKDHKIIGILLNSSSRREEMGELLDFALQEQGITPPR